MRDGVYGPAVNLLRQDVGSRNRFIGRQEEGVLAWAVNRNLSFRSAYSVFHPGPYMKDTGLRENVHFVLTNAVFDY